MSTKMVASLSKLKNTSVAVVPVDAYKEPGAATIQLAFSDSSALRAEYWRLIKNGKERVSSFDHQQKYGLPAPIDAIRILRNELSGKTVESVELDQETGDLLFRFTGTLKLQVFGFTGYEMWEINIAGLGSEYSNYAKEVCSFTPGDFGNS